jgi:hypothetical protein
MADYFGHARLKVYQKGMQFASMLRQLSKAVRDDI